MSVQQIQAIKLVCEVCGSQRIIEKTDVLPRRCAVKSCQSARWNASGQANEDAPHNNEATPHNEDKQHKEVRQSSTPKVSLDDVAAATPSPARLARQVKEAAPAPEPKEKSSRLKKQKKIKVSGKLCPHGYAVYDGMTACERCNATGE